jgi:hypothetical protein
MDTNRATVIRWIRVSEVTASVGVEAAFLSFTKSSWMCCDIISRIKEPIIKQTSATASPMVTLPTFAPPTNSLNIAKVSAEGRLI